MRILFTILTACCISVIGTQSRAETPPWLELLQQDHVAMDSVQNAYDTWFATREKGKGTYWKLFERWKARHESIVRSDGTVASPREVSQSLVVQKQRMEQVLGPESNPGFWRELGPWDTPENGTGQPTGVGRVNALAIDPFDNEVLYAGAPDGGLWRGSITGDDWVQLNSDQLIELGVSAVLPDPNELGVLLIGTGDRDGGNTGMGVWRYDNGTWSPSHEGMPDCIVGKLVYPVGQTDVILAGTLVGMFRSVDGGVNWTSVSENMHIKELVGHPTDSDILYASANGFVYRTTDMGLTWIQVEGGLPQQQLTRTALAVSPDEPNYVYALVAGSSIDFLGLYLSKDAGQTFIRQSWAEVPSAETPNILGYAFDGSEAGGQGWYDLTVAVDPRDASRVFCATVSVWMSENEGVDWTNIGHWGSQIHADHHALMFTDDGATLLDGNDGGVYIIDPDTFEYEDISDGLGIGQVYRIGQSTLDRDIVLNGYQDNGCAVYDDGHFVTNAGGDGAEVLVDWSTSQYQFNSYGSTIRRSKNYGKNSHTIASQGTNGLTESGAYLTPYALDVEDPNIMYLGYANLWRADSVRGIVAWENITPNLDLAEGTIRAISQSRTEPNVMFIARNDGTVYKTANIRDEQPVWEAIHDASLWGQAVLDLQVHPRNPNIVWLISSGKVFRSHDGGYSWTDQTRNIPENSGPRCLAIDPSVCEGVYVGLQHSVVYIDNTMDEWISFDARLPRVAINELEIFSSAGRSVLRAATWGRGLWETPLYSNPDHNSIIADVSSEYVRTGDSLRVRVYNGSTPQRVQIHVGEEQSVGIDVGTEPTEVLMQIPIAGVHPVTVLTGDNKDTLWLAGTIVAANTPLATCTPETKNLGNFTMGIRRIAIGEFTFTSGQAHQDNSVFPAGYLERAYSHVFELKGGEHTIEVEVGTNYEERIAVFVDINNDGDFEDENERVWDSPKAIGIHAGTFEIPSEVEGTVVRMRFISDDAVIESPCHIPNYGQVEDYGLRVVSGVDFANGSVQVQEQTATLTIDAVASEPIENSGVMWTVVGAPPSFSSAIGQQVSDLSKNVVVEGLPISTSWLYAFVQTRSGTFFSEPIEVTVAEPIPMVEVMSADVVQHTHVAVSSSITESGTQVLTHGVLWGLTDAVTLSNASGVTAHSGFQQNWEDVLGGLPPGKEVYVKTYVYTCSGIYYSDAMVINVPHASPDQHRSISFHRIGVTSATVSWKKQTYDGSIVALTPDIAFWEFPVVDTEIPSASAMYGGEEQYVYVGQDNAVRVEGLVPASTYRARAFGASMSGTIEAVDTRPGYDNPNGFSTYCLPEFFNPSVGTHITEVFADGEALSVESTLGDNFSTRVLSVQPSDSNRTIEIVARGSYNRVFFNAWLDENNNQEFEDHERVADNLELVPDNEVSFEFQVPPHKNTLQYRLRMRVTWGKSSQPCQDWNWGETEDILIQYPTVVSVEEPVGNESVLTVSPNPASNHVRVHDVSSHDEATYSIVDIQGRLLHDNRKLGTGNISVYDLANGTYYVIVHTGGTSYSVPLQIVR